MSGIGSFSDSVRIGGRHALDIPVAALPAVAIAFVAFAAPPELLADLVASTGLPEILPAAEPPLGNKARIGLGAFGAVFVFALVFGLLRLLDRKPSVRRERKVEAPQTRRRDRHPDAPSRRPISATLEFGEPVSSAPEVPGSDVPAWLLPAQISGEVELSNERVEAPVETVVQPQVAQDAIESPRTIDRDLLRAIDAPLFDGPKTGPATTQSVAELMTRLERGLARRQPSAEPPVESAAETLLRSKPARRARPAAEVDSEDDRLQSAIDSLQRFASRQI